MPLSPLDSSLVDEQVLMAEVRKLRAALINIRHACRLYPMDAVEVCDSEAARVLKESYLKLGALDREPVVE